MWATVTWRGRYWRSRVARWAEAEGLQLIDYRAARRDEGPAGAAPAENPSVFRVRLRDRDGAIKEASLTFGRRRGPQSPPDELIEVRWDESRRAV